VKKKINGEGDYLNHKYIYELDAIFLSTKNINIVIGHERIKNEKVMKI
jgi:hypothetical protein